jgi:hypothetical protein
MNVRAICQGHFSVPMRVAAAVPLFTPEGERRWAGSSWDPVYAIPDAARDDSAPGTVFTTESDGGAAIWIALDRHEDGMRYARIAPDRIAGTITVSCAEAASSDETQVTVTYDVTSLGPEGAAFVEELKTGYDGFLESWRQEILAHLAGTQSLLANDRGPRDTPHMDARSNVE